MNRLLLEDERAADALVRFANLPRVRTQRDVERCFDELVDFDEFRPRHGDIKIEDVYVRIQTVARAWLALIATGVEGRKKVATRVSALLADTISASVQAKRGRLALAYHFGNSVQGACAFGAALILDERRGLTNRLKRCRYCGKYSLALRSQGRGPLRKFCSDEHARLFWNKDSNRRQKAMKARHAKLKQKGRKP